MNGSGVQMRARNARTEDQRGVQVPRRYIANRLTRSSPLQSQLFIKLDRKQRKDSGQHTPLNGIRSQGRSRKDAIRVDNVDLQSSKDEQKTHSEWDRSENGYDKVDLGRRGPCENKETYWKENGPEASHV